MKPGYEPIPKTVRELRQRAHEGRSVAPDMAVLDAEAADEIMRLRVLLALNYCPMLYGDDGELQDNRYPHPIDFARDSIQEIESKMGMRDMQKLIDAGVVKVTSPAQNSSREVKP